jgi:hypothetical protein
MNLFTSLDCTQISNLENEEIELCDFKSCFHHSHFVIDFHCSDDFSIILEKWYCSLLVRSVQKATADCVLEPTEEDFKE